MLLNVKKIKLIVSTFYFLPFLPVSIFFKKTTKKIEDKELMLHVVELITEIKKLESNFLIDKIHPREYLLNRSKIIFGVLEIANAYAYPSEKSDLKKFERLYRGVFFVC